jgi:hypothetical protein
MRRSLDYAWLTCANCGDPLDGSGSAVRGPDTAWHAQCLACHELVAGQLELAEDGPGGAPIQIYRCRLCGTARSCRAGWRTRCHICLDERSSGAVVTAAGQAFLARLEHDPRLAAQARQFLGLTLGETISLRGVAMASAYITLSAELRQLDRPGWVILATDVYGLPWTGERNRRISHGTWARHHCGTVAKLHPGTVDCPACGPEPASRTHLARRDEPYLLYLVTTRRWQKFGVGDVRRVREHLRGDAVVIRVLQAPFAEVILAEKALKQRYRDATQRRAKRGMIASFGQGTEVTRSRITINLTDVLPDGEDVTAWFCG